MNTTGVIYFSQTSIQSQEAETQVQHVHIQVVEKVPLYDYSQAQKTWDALTEAGMEPGKLVVQGLENGHNYPVKQLKLKNRVKKQSSTQPIQSSQTSTQALVSYTRERQTSVLRLSSQGLKKGQKTLVKLNNLSLDNQEEIEQLNIYAVTPENQLQSREEIPMLTTGPVA